MLDFLNYKKKPPRMQGNTLMMLDVLYKIFAQREIEYLVAGGYVRDMYFQNLPKDVDVFVADLEHVTHILNELGVSFQEFSVYNDTETNRFTGVIKIGDIDIIGISEDAYSPLDQVRRYFDYNINQFALINGKPTFVGEDFGRLTRASDELCTPERAAHINSIAVKVNWDVKTT
jgi:hypothetical protein